MRGDGEERGENAGAGLQFLLPDNEQMLSGIGSWCVLKRRFPGFAPAASFPGAQAGTPGRAALGFSMVFLPTELQLL